VEGYERLTRDTLMTALSAPAGSSRRDLRAKNLSDLDLHGIDFKGADLSSSVFNGANLQGAKLDNTNLTVAFSNMPTCRNPHFAMPCFSPPNSPVPMPGVQILMVRGSSGI